MTRNYVWVCDNCYPPDDNEVKSLGFVGVGACSVCTEIYKGGKLNCVARNTGDKLYGWRKSLSAPTRREKWEC